MRLAIIRQRYGSDDGVEGFMESAVEALLERGVAVSLYTRQWPRTRLQLIESTLCDPFYLGRLWRDRGFARVVCKAIRERAPELVESHERLLCCDLYRADEGVYEVRCEEMLRDASPAQRRLRELNPYHRYLLDLERRLFANPTLRAVVCKSHMVRDEIRDRFGVDEAKLSVIYTAVDSESFSPAVRAHRAAVREKLKLPESGTVFLMVGADGERMGVAAAIAALAQLPGDSYLLVSAADRHRRRDETLVRDLGLAGRVIQLGIRHDPKPLFGAADAFVLPTPYDPLPPAALQAMACGLPVITSDKCGAAELVLEHDAGFVCPARDVDALARHMMSLTDGQARDVLGTRARHAVAALTPVAMTLKLVLLYRDLFAAPIAAAAARDPG